MSATYLRKGQGKSDNAYYAQNTGKWPLTRAIKIISVAIKPYYKVPRRIIRDWLELQGACEWHHVGKYATPCDYYDTESVISALFDPFAGYWETNIKGAPIFWGNSFLECFE